MKKYHTMIDSFCNYLSRLNYIYRFEDNSHVPYYTTTYELFDIRNHISFLVCFERFQSLSLIINYKECYQLLLQNLACYMESFGFLVPWIDPSIYRIYS